MNNTKEVTPQKRENTAFTPTVIRLGLVSFFADVASEMLYPLTPIFLTSVLGATAFNVGVIEGVAEGIASLLKVYSGSWSDRIGKRKTFVWLGYLLGALSKPLTGFSTSWWDVLGARSIDRFGKGIRTAPRDALLSESVHESKRGTAFGWHRAMDTMGAAVGPLLAVYFLSKHSEPNDLRSIYYYAVIPGIFSVLIALSIRETAKPLKQEKSLLPKTDWMSRDFKKYLSAMTVFALVNSSDVFLLLKVQREGLAITQTILLYAFYNLLYSLTSPYLGHLSDRLGRKKVLITGLLVFAFVYGCFGFAKEPWQFWCLFGIYGVYMAATDGVGKAFVVDLVPTDLKATGLGLLGTVTGFATIVASSVAGFLWDNAGAEWTFIYGAVGAASSVFILLLLPRHKAAR